MASKIGKSPTALALLNLFEMLLSRTRAADSADLFVLPHTFIDQFIPPPCTTEKKGRKSAQLMMGLTNTPRKPYPS